MLVDSTGLGDPIYDFIKQIYPHVIPFNVSHTKRRPLIDNLALMIEEVEVTWPDIPEIMRELQVFGIERGRSGTEKYKAPRGFNDDIIFSLALAAWQLRRGSPPGFTWVDW
jgi:hypothetical protein